EATVTPTITENTNTTSELKLALDNKTWGEYREGSTYPKSCYIFSDNKITAYFDGDRTTSSELTYEINNDKLNYFLDGQQVSSTDTFSKVSDTEFNVHKVWSDDVDNRVWKVTSNCVDIVQEDEDNGFTKEMLQNKVLYSSHTEEDGDIEYTKTTFISDTSFKFDDIKVRLNGTVEDRETITFDFVLENKIIKFNPEGNGHTFWTLNSQDDTAWYITQEFDRGDDGTIDETDNQTLYFEKPADYPAEL
ncbi:hypothetical protein GSY74_01400, partial [Sulfurovum sp. bin170]|uniref:hypothetical protein n=1 Tax=Sulfurovum sp. bin170 TaxID=2695268 RepID=UPI0013DF23B4